MISKDHRFQGHHSLHFVYRKGQTVRGPMMALKYALNPRRTEYRLAIVVSRKVHKSAVVRNRIRRRLYEAARLRAASFGAYDLVITVYSDQVAELSVAKLTKMLDKLLEDAHVSNPHPTSDIVKG